MEERIAELVADKIKGSYGVGIEDLTKEQLIKLAASDHESFMRTVSPRAQVMVRRDTETQPASLRTIIFYLTPRARTI